MEQKQHPSLEQAALQAGLSGPDRDSIARGTLEKVYCAPASGLVDLCLRADPFPAAEACRALSEELCRQLGCSRLRLLPSLTVQELPGLWPRYQEHLLELLGEISLILKGSVSGIRLGDDGRLRLVLNAASTLNYLQKKGLTGPVESLFSRLTGEKQALGYEVVEDAGFSLQIQELEHIRLRQVPEAPEGPADRVAETPVLLGKAISGSPTPLEEITEEEKSVVCQGRISGLEIRELRSGRDLITFHLVSKVSGITVKLFVDEKTPDVAGRLKNGLFVRIRGAVQQDRYSQELTLLARDICGDSEPVRTDDAEEKRVELHLHTRMSALDAMTDLEEVLLRAAAWEHPAVAITDHGGVQAFPSAWGLIKKHRLDLKVIYGMEAYFVNDLRESQHPKRPYHLIILVKNQEGFRNLYKLVTSSNLNHFYRRPRVLASELARSREGLILGSACEAGEVFQGLLQGKSPEEMEEIVSLYDYLEIQPEGNNEFLLRDGLVADREALRELNRQVIRLAESAGKPVVATCDVHFLDREDGIYREIIQKGQGYSDTTQPPLYFRTTQEMLKEFAWLGEEMAYRVVVTNTREIAASVDPDLVPVQTRLHTPTIEGADEEIQNSCRKRARELYGDPLPEPVEKRLDKELNSIVTHGFSVLYLIAQKLVKKSNDDGYLVGSRGSVGSSFVATLLGVTEVNPLAPHYLCPECRYSRFLSGAEVGCGADLPDQVCPRCGTVLLKDGHDIPFETFLGFNGDKVPDIDLNFSGEYQPVIHKYTETLFGASNVFKAGTIATVADKTAFGFVRKYQEEMGKTACRTAETLALAAGCTGVKRTTGQHPGGLIVLPQGLDVNLFTPLQRPADDVNSDIVTSHFDYHSIDASLVKLDLLGHDDPTVIRMLEDITGVDARKIRLDDPETLSLFSSAEVLNLDPDILDMEVGSLGIPEFGTKFVRQMLTDTRPQAFSELVRISGFSHGTDVWLNNAQDLIRSGTARLAEAISTRDDIMVYLLQKEMEPLSAFRIMEDVRKGKGLKPEYEEAMRAAGVPAWYIESCRKIKYMFPKAHAVAYVTMAFRIAWFKVNHPEAFYAAYFTVRADEFDLEVVLKGPEEIRKALKAIDALPRPSAREKSVYTILELALEMYARGIRMLPLDLDKSQATRFVIGEKTLLPPFNALAGLGEKAARAVVESREEKPFASVDDLRIRGRLSATLMDKLREMGVLEGLPESEQMSLFEAMA